MGDGQPKDGDPAFDLFDRWLDHHGQARAQDSGPATAAETGTVEPAAATEPATEPAPPATRVPAEATDAVGRRGESTNVDFAPRPGSRRLTGLLLLAALGATGAAAYYAYEDPNTLTVGVTGTLALLSLVLWAIRAGSATPQLSVRRGQLEIQAGGKRAVFDLTSQFTPVEVVGRPGQRGWRVVLDRRDDAPFVVDSSMVDPQEFMRVLRRYRPELMP